jgi:hypothetical protein
VLRACIVNFHTQLADVQALVDIVVREGRIVERELRAASSGSARSMDIQRQ